MEIMVNYTTRGGGLSLFLVALAVLTGCQPGPTKVQEAQNIEGPRQNVEQADTAEITSPPANLAAANPAVVSADTWTDGDWPLTIDGGPSHLHRI